MFVGIQNSLDSWTEADILKGESASRSQRMTKKVGDLIGITDTYTTTYSGFDIYDYPQTTYEYNNFNGKKRYTKQFYLHDLTNRLIGLPTITQVSSNGSTYQEVAKTTYHSATGSYKSLPNYHYEFGRWYKRNTSYHTSGTQAGLPNKVDYNGINRWIYFSNYKRGKAQTIRTPQSLSTASQYAYLSVDDNGWVTKTTDFMGNCTNYGYSSIGRLTLIDPCDTRWLNTNITYTTTTSNEGLSYVYSDMLKQTITRGNYEKVTYFDSLLRARLTKEWDKTKWTTERYVRTDYDWVNRPTYQSNPWLNSGTFYGNITEYDGLGRVKTVDNNTTSGTIDYTYLSDNRVQVNDNKGNVTTTTYLAYGSPSQQQATYIAAPHSTNTTMVYNIYGNMTSVLQGGLTEHRVYDSYQNLCKTTRPDVGNTAMAYNALNQVTWSAQGNSISSSTASCDTSVTASDKATYVYDNLGNVKTVTFSDGSPNQTYVYDKNSQLTALIAGDVTTSYEYNSAQLLEKETLNVDSQDHVLDYVYNDIGNLSSMVYPSNATVDYEPNALGQPNRVGNYATNASYHASGAIKTHQYSNGYSYKMTQYSSGMPATTYDRLIIEDTPCFKCLPPPVCELCSVSTSEVGINVVPPGGYNYSYAIDHSFTYDANNNLTFWDDRVIVKGLPNYDFKATYDGLDRLDVITQSYSGTGDVNYDTMGNITYYKIGSKTLNYFYNGSKQLTSVSGYQSKTFGYDDKGNVTSNGNHIFGYNTANQMVSSSVGTYVYDGHNKRVKQVDSQGTSYSMYSRAGKLVYRNVNGVHTDYYHLGNKLVAKKKGFVVSYIHTDYLGSPAAETNGSGTVTARMHYQPFGESIEVPKDDVGYTGHKFDADLGLSYMQARYYDPVIGRFYSNDPKGALAFLSEGKVQGFNRYAYAFNNPYKYTDPDGKSPCLGICVALVVTAKVAHKAYKMHKASKNIKRGKEIGKMIKKDGTTKASDIVKKSEKLGLKRSKTKDGPLKMKDEKGTDRVTIKNGSDRAPGSNRPHVELKDSKGQRVSPEGKPVSRKSPENHTPIKNDL